MSLFENQIEQRAILDERSLQDTYRQLGEAVAGHGKVHAALNDDHVKAQSAFEEIYHYYRVTPEKPAVEPADMEELLRYQLEPTGLRHRAVRLDEKWYRQASGAMLGVTVDGDPVALIPNSWMGYHYIDPQTGHRVRVNRRVALDRLSGEALCFYKPFPAKKLTLRDLARYCLEQFTWADVLALVLATLALTLLGLVMPAANQILLGQVVPLKERSLLVPVALVLLGTTLASTMIGVIKNLLYSRINMRIQLSVKAASMSRLMSLPASFFKRFSSGETVQRQQAISSLCDIMTSALLSTGLTGVLSLIYLGQIASFAPELTLPALMVVVAQLLFTLLTTLSQLKVQRKLTLHEARHSGLTYALLSGVQKLKLAGAEKRALAKWGEEYSEGARLMYRPPLLVRIGPAVTTAIGLAGTLGFYFLSATSRLSAADYVAFSLSFGLISGAIASLGEMGTVFAELKPTAELAAPVLEAVPEYGTGKRQVARLSGNIELSNVSFRYQDNMPWVLDNLSLKIRAGQYVAIVGKTGCGKSTLMRLLLGFETPQKGGVYYDRQDLSKLDLPSVRRFIGVVLQNGKLFQGDIFSNITVAAPNATLEDAWQAAELSGIAEDIRNMPMGMNTIIAEGGGGISGGQKQRLMIARAIAAKPKLLMLDEATSALDNLTQRIVTESLDTLKCTRLVIAHRLSTIRTCDRIVVLDGGKIVQDGSYDELIRQPGLFRELVQRQQLEPLDEPQE